MQSYATPIYLTELVDALGVDGVRELALCARRLAKQGTTLLDLHYADLNDLLMTCAELCERDNADLRATLRRFAPDAAHWLELLMHAFCLGAVYMHDVTALDADDLDDEHTRAVSLPIGAEDETSLTIAA